MRESGVISHHDVDNHVPENLMHFSKPLVLWYRTEGVDSIERKAPFFSFIIQASLDAYAGFIRYVNWNHWVNQLIMEFYFYGGNYWLTNARLIFYVIM